MGPSLTWLKTCALEAFISLRSSIGKKTRAADRRGLARCTLSSDAEHISAALNWIRAAQDHGNDDGVAAMYSFVDGCVNSYAETTGYFIPTMYSAANFSDASDCASSGCSAPPVRPMTSAS